MAHQSWQSDIKAPGQNTNATTRGVLVTGSIYMGVVSAVDAGNKLYEVKVLPDHTPIPGCVWAAGSVFSCLLGFKSNYTPTIGTMVAVLYENQPWIIAAAPSDIKDALNVSNKTITGCDTNLHELDAYRGKAGAVRHTPPNDLLEGEFEINNYLGVGIQFLMNLAKLSAGNRAAVEVHLLNDMVRIISENFKHYTSFGDFEVYNDGKLNVRWDGTSYPHEAAGVLKEGDPVGVIKDGVPDLTAPDKIVDTGRWRFSQFVGFLGDFINMFVTDPTDELGKLAKDAFRSGKARLHVGNDGTILVQSVREITLERVVRIVVPVEVKRHEDPKGVTEEAFKTLETDFLKFWDFGGKEGKTIHHTAFQIREYARWLSSYHSLARFHQMAKAGEEWYVPKETESGADSKEPKTGVAWTAKEKDKESKNAAFTNTYDTYSCIRIMADGGILLLDGYGSSICSVKGSLYVSSAKDLMLQSAGSIKMVAGQDIHMLARRNIEVTAVKGGIKMKARAWLHALCEWGSIWVKSDAVNLDASEPPKPEDEVHDPKPLVYKQAILIETSHGRAMMSSQEDAIIQSRGAASDVILESKSRNVALVADNGNITSKAGRDIGITAKGDLGITTKSVSAKLEGQLDINNKFTVNAKSGDLNVNSVRSERVTVTTSIQGTSEKILKLRDEDIDKARPVFADPMYFKGDETDKPVIGVIDAQMKFDFESDADYGYVTDDDALFETLTQQYIRLDNKADEDKYSDWQFSDNKLKPAPRNGTNTPFIGSKTKHLTHDGGESLHTPSSKDPSTLNKKTDLKQSPVSLKFRKKSK